MILGLNSRWQNLKGEDAGSKRGLHGRAWISWPSRNKYPDSTVRTEWHTSNPVYLFGGYMDVSADETYFSFGVFLWPCSFYLSVESRLARFLATRLVGEKWDGERQIQFVLSPHDGGTFRWNLWTPSSSWSSKTPKWRNGHFNPLDFIFGQWDYTNEIVSTHDVIIPMPEASYPGIVQMWRSTWTRRRFHWWNRSISRANIDVKNPPQFAGKGENSWDCEDDGIYSMTCPAESVDAAIEKYRSSAFSSRKRYGNPDGYDRLVSGATG